VDSAYWKFRKVMTLGMVNYNKYAPIIKEAYLKFEAETDQRQREMEEEYLRIYKTQPLRAKDMLQEFSDSILIKGMELADSPITAPRLAALVGKIADGTLSSKLAKKAFEAMWAEPEASIAEIIEKHGLQQMTDTSAIEAMVDEVLANNAKAVEQFKSGNEKALNAIVGQVMKASKGKANPAQVQELIKAKLG